MKKHKKLIYGISAIIIIIGTIIPSFALQGIAQITTVDLSSNISNTQEISIDGNYNILQVRLDTSTNHLIIETLVQDQQIQELYSIYMPELYIANIELEINSSTTKFGQINKELGLLSVDTSIANSPSEYGCYINIELLPGSKLYTYEDLISYGQTQYELGQQYAIGNPNAYSLWTQEQYLEYGNQKYAQGQLRGIELAENSNYSQGYTDGLNQGHKDAGTIKGIANIAITGIYNVFTNITGSTSIFGVTLISVIVSALIILIIYFIFKLERSWIIKY